MHRAKTSLQQIAAILLEAHYILKYECPDCTFYPAYIIFIYQPTYKQTLALIMREHPAQLKKKKWHDMISQ